MLITLSRHNNEIITQAAPPLIQNIFKVSPPYRICVKQSPDSRIQGPDQILFFAVRNQLKINRFISHEIHGNQFEVVTPLHQCPLNFPLKKKVLFYFLPMKVAQDTCFKNSLVALQLSFSVSPQAKNLILVSLFIT